MASSFPATEYKEISLLLLGKTGNGKSATGNTILGWSAFATADRSRSKTKNITLHCSDLDDGLRVRVVDTPGVINPEKTHGHNLKKMYEALSLFPNGFNAIIFVLKFGCRYTKEEIESVKELKNYFGATVLQRFGIIVMTQGESFDLHRREDKLTFEDWLKKQNKAEQGQSFSKLLGECSNRCVLFYNVGKKYDLERKESKKKLLGLIDDQKGALYRTNHIENAKKERENVIKNLKNPILCTAVQEQLSLMIQQIDCQRQNITFLIEETIEKLKIIDVEIDSIVKDLSLTTNNPNWKNQIASLIETCDKISKTSNRQKQDVMLAQLLHDLQNLKETKDTLEKYSIYIICDRMVKNYFNWTACSIF